MLNQIIIIGKLDEIYDDHIVMTIGNPVLDDKLKEYYVDVYFTNNLLENMKKHTDIGDVIGIKGFIRVANGLIEIVAQKVTFLSHSVKGGESSE